MQFKEREFLPVILGADFATYSLARSFHEEYGVKTLAVSMAATGYIQNSDIIENRVFENLDKKEVLVEKLTEIGKEFEGKKKLIVMGCGDWYVRALIESKHLLEKYYIIPYIDEELYNKIVLKDKFYEIFEELNLDYPNTYVYHCGEENTLDFDFEYPIIGKPSDSSKYHYASFEGQDKVFTFHNRDEMLNVLDKLEKSTYDSNFIIQDKIPGDDTNMRILTCYCDHNSKVRFASFGRTLLEDHAPTAIGNPVAIINDVNEDVVKAATKFLEHIGYVGFANFDIKYDKRDGKYKFFEINVRLGRSNFYVTGSGFNAVKWIVDDYIYNDLGEYTVADNICLYTVVPKYVIKKYVPDGEIKTLALKLFKEGKVSYPLDYKKDKNLKQRFYAKAVLYNQIRKFKRYF